MITMTALETLFANKYLLAAIAAVAGGIYFYAKGYSSGKEGEKQKSIEIMDRIENEIRLTEAKNQKIDKERMEDEKAVNDAADIDSLLKLWTDVDQKTKRDHPDSKS